MAILVPPFGEPFQLREHIDRLRLVLAALEGLAQGRHPTSHALSAAPTIEEWVLASRSSPCLKGQFLGHPKIGWGHAGTTSDLWVHAPSHGYAQTLSRLYRLGDPATVTDGKCL